MGRRWQAGKLTASARKYATIYCSYGGTYTQAASEAGGKSGGFARDSRGEKVAGGWQLTCLCLPAAGGHFPSAQMQPKVAEQGRVSAASAENGESVENGEGRRGEEETVT